MDWRERLKEKIGQKVSWEQGAKRTRLSVNSDKKLEAQRRLKSSAEIRDLSSLSAAKRQEAIRNFENLPKEWRFHAISLLLDKSVFTGIPLSCFCFSPIIALIGLGAIGSIMGNIVSWDLSSPAPSIILSGLLAVLLAVVPSPGVFRFIQEANGRKTFDEILSACEDKAVVPLFLKKIFSHDLHIESQKPLFIALSAKIERFFPDINESDLSEWSLMEKTMLIHALTSKDFQREPAFSEATRLEVLRLIEIVGKKRSLKVVQAMAEGKWNATPALKQRALEALPILIERVERLENERTLLRASSHPEESDSLLRPATGGSDSRNLGELLRPVGENSELLNAAQWRQEEIRDYSTKNEQEVVALNRGDSDAL